MNTIEVNLVADIFGSEAIGIDMKFQELHLSGSSFFLSDFVPVKLCLDTKVVNLGADIDGSGSIGLDMKFQEQS